jgi:hypothetical protein
VFGQAVAEALGFLPDMGAAATTGPTNQVLGAAPVFVGNAELTLPVIKTMHNSKNAPSNTATVQWSPNTRRL